MSVTGEYVVLPEEYEILKEINLITQKDISNFQFMQVVKNLNSSYPHVRVKCLKVIGQYIDPSSHFPCGTSTTFDIVQWYTQDSDARVRETAFELYLNWLELGFELPNFGLVYELLQTALNDSEDEVVITCLKLVVKMANTQPDLEIPSPSTTLGVTTNTAFRQKSRLCDKSFCCVAGAMFHASSSVRRKAATLLSQIKEVSESLMLETLEKTVMKDKIIKKSVLDRTNTINKLFWIDELNNNLSNKKFMKLSYDQIETPEEAMAMGGINGALIYGLEDDFYEIRSEAIKTIGKLSMQSEKFAISCQDLLVDMLTDDIEIVRSHSVINLSIASGIKHNMMLRTDQLDIVLSILSEKSGNMRRSIHQLLSMCRLASAHSLMRLVDGLLYNLRMYEMDRDSIWRCSAQVGKNHPELVQVNLNSLLKMHPYIVFQDPSKSDPAYITVLLMVINASHKLESIKTSFPTHVKTNEIYLRELLPELICHSDNNGDEEPPHKQVKYDEDADMAPHSSVSRQDLYSYLRDTIRTLHKVLFGPNFQSQGNSNLMRLLLQDLRQISGLCDETRGLCLWLRDLGQLARLTQQMPMALYRLQEGRYLAHKMIYAYTGIPDTDIKYLSAFIQDIDLKIKCIQEQNIIPTRETKEVLSTTPPISHLKSLSILTCIDNNCSVETIHSLLSRITQVTAKQIHPTAYDTQKLAFKFCAGMSLSLSVRAEFFGLDITIDVNDQINVKTPVAVVVNRPDGLSFFWQPPDHCWSISKKDNLPDVHKVFFLDTEVPMSFSEWSEPGPVHLGLVVLLPNKELTWKLTEPVGVKIHPICANKCL